MKARHFGKVAVLMGGPSAERAVSLKSGTAVLEALKRQGIDAYGIDAERDVLDKLVQGKFDRVFNALHGRWGEDGVIQGGLEVIGLPYTGSGVLASALGMDKLRSKDIWTSANVPTPEYAALTTEVDIDEVIKRLGSPLFVKPAREGSSIGMSKAHTSAELKTAWVEAAKYDDNVLVERCIVGSELTVGILGNMELPLIRIETPRAFYDYEAKYLLDSTRYICPSGLAPSIELDIQAMARKAFTAIGCHGWGRVDVMLDKEAHPYVIEINTVPGMTDHSLVPKAAQQAGIGFDELVLRILETADIAR